MDSSESVNSELNGASTCVTYADWACVCVYVCECVCLYALPAVWVPLPQPRLTCPASSLLTRLLDKQGRGGRRQEDEGREERGEGAGVRAADHASLPGNQECGGSLSHKQATSSHSYAENYREQGGRWFFIWNRLPETTQHWHNSK